MLYLALTLYLLGAWLVGLLFYDAAVDDGFAERDMIGSSVMLGLLWPLVAAAIAVVFPVFLWLGRSVGR